MIFHCAIGDYETSLDDEIATERPTPEQAADYLTRCAQVCLGLYTAAGVAETSEGAT